MALLVHYCAVCQRRTEHRFDGDGKPQFSVCCECGHAHPLPPLKDLYRVTFTNMADTSMNPASGQFLLEANWSADDAAEAIRKALPWAIAYNRREGLPPHGVQVSDDELQCHASAVLEWRADQSDADDDAPDV